MQALDLTTAAVLQILVVIESLIAIKVCANKDFEAIRMSSTGPCDVLHDWRAVNGLVSSLE
jgi:hypothetical protein